MSSDTTLEQSTWTIRQIWMLTVACCAVALVVAAMAALNTALPDLARDTGATQSQLTWIVDGYTLTLLVSCCRRAHSAIDTVDENCSCSDYSFLLPARRFRSSRTNRRGSSSPA